MKKTILLLLVNSIFILSSFGQNKSGMVVYEQKINMHRRMTDESIKAMVPEFRTDKDQLQFNGCASIYKRFEGPEEEESITEENNGGVMITIKTPENIVYKNY